MLVNYKYDILKFYLVQLDYKYDICFFKEDKLLGIIGSVLLLKDKILIFFFVFNCDIIIDQDYRDVYDYYINNSNDFIIVMVVKRICIFYGVIEIIENGLMIELIEKFEFIYMINLGVYILQFELINEILENELFYIIYFMEKVKSRGGKIGCFFVSEKLWIDIGEWNEYLKLFGI